MGETKKKSWASAELTLAWWEAGGWVNYTPITEALGNVSTV